jgi:hypothetical protein
MKIKDYSIIETDAMLDLFDICERVNNGDTDFKALRQRILRIKSKLKPLTPIVENAFQEARVFDSLDGPVDIDVVLSFGGDMSDLSPRIVNSEEYINNTIIE